MKRRPIGDQRRYDVAVRPFTDFDQIRLADRRVRFIAEADPPFDADLCLRFEPLEPSRR